MDQERNNDEGCTFGNQGGVQVPGSSVYGKLGGVEGGMKDPGPPVTKTFESGAQREALEHEVRYDLISPFGLARLAQTYAGGAMKYSDHNWRKGMPFSSLMNHVLNHLTLYQQDEGGEDHLAHAAWGLFAMMEFEETDPEQNDLYFHADNEGLPLMDADTLLRQMLREGPPSDCVGCPDCTGSPHCPIDVTESCS